MLGVRPPDRDRAGRDAVLRQLGGPDRRAGGPRGRRLRRWRPTTASRSLTIGTPGAGQPARGTARSRASPSDIDDQGRLCIDTGAEVLTVSAGDITHLRPVNRMRVNVAIVGYPDNVLAADEQVVLHRHPHWKRLIWPVAGS